MTEILREIENEKRMGGWFVAFMPDCTVYAKYKECLSDSLCALSHRYRKALEKMGYGVVSDPGLMRITWGV